MLGKKAPMLGSAWLQFLLLETAALVAAFLLHPPTDWMVFEVAPALIITVATGFAATRARHATLRRGCSVLTTYCLLWTGMIIGPVARDLGYVPPAVEVESVFAAGSARGRGYGWRGREGLTEYVCSITIFDLSPNMTAKWSANGAEALGQAAARLPRWWSGIGQFSSWAPPPKVSEGLPLHLEVMYSRSEDECGVGHEETSHAVTHAWASRYTLLGEVPGAAMLLVLEPRYPYAVMIRYREYCVGAAPPHPCDTAPQSQSGI